MRRDELRLSARAAVTGLLFVGLAGVAEAQVATELAGVDLASFPHFLHLRSFGPETPVAVTVDPARHPRISGATCTIYVVAAKTADEWSSDPALVDGTLDGPLAHSFSGADVAANRVIVVPAGELDSDPRNGLGVPYDLVLDCNGNGTLDDGDFIDGRGDEAGLYAVHDTTLRGPRPVVTVGYAGAGHTQVAYHPADLGPGELLPLVSISHGWTHEYRWYDHIGVHLASYGYIVMSHVNEVGNGGPAATETASTSTLQNVDWLLSRPPEAGAFAEHVDRHRIVFIGHSTGGEGVVRAYTRLAFGEYTPQEFATSDVVLLAPIAPVNWLPASQVHPFDVDFHMFAGAADTDTSNGPLNSYQQLLQIYERAFGNKQLTYIHGAGHADFHNGSQPSSDWAFGPDLLGRERTHRVVLGYLLPLVERYVEDNPAARDFFEQMDDTLRPRGIDPSVVIAGEYRDANQALSFVLDDHQLNPDPAVSSSGGAVSWSVSHLVELLMRDTDSSFAWTGAQESNGLTRADSGADDERGVVFDWAPGADAFYELEIRPAQRDLTDDGLLSFRAAQGTRHPETVALAGPLTFTVTLRDGAGAERSTWIGNYGAITRPYQRTGAGAGAGWASEFSTVRIPLEDFAAGGGFDLADVVAVRFEFGSSFGSERGRLVLDDIELARPDAPAPFHLSLARAGESATLRWPPQLQAVEFNVYRGTIPHGGMGQAGVGIAAYDHVCLDAGDALGDGALVAVDAEPVPLDRAGFYYLVSAVLPVGEGPLGQASVDLDPELPGEQRERPNASPCAP